jgi:hypothetical protein
MCFGGSKAKDPAPPAPAPAPAEPTASVAQAEPQTESSTRSDAARKGRRALRIDTTAPTVSGGSGLNIPV